MAFRWRGAVAARTMLEADPGIIIPAAPSSPHFNASLRDRPDLFLFIILKVLVVVSDHQLGSLMSAEEFLRIHKCPDEIDHCISLRQTLGAHIIFGNLHLFAGRLA